jgi:hypothetical protein
MDTAGDSHRRPAVPEDRLGELARQFAPETFRGLSAAQRADVLARCEDTRWTEAESDHLEHLLARHVADDDSGAIGMLLRRRGERYLGTVARLPAETLVILMAAGEGTRLNLDPAADASRWVDKNTEKLGGVSQLERHLTQLAALGFADVLVLVSARSVAAAADQSRSFRAWLRIRLQPTPPHWMNGFSGAVVQAVGEGFRRVLLLNGEAIVPLQYLARMRFTDRERVFGFHVHPRGLNDARLDHENRRLLEHAPAVETTPGERRRALLTMLAPAAELAAAIGADASLEWYVTAHFRAPSTAAFEVRRRVDGPAGIARFEAAQVPDLDTPGDLQARHLYHLHCLEILGPFPYEQMVHPRALPRAILAKHGLFYPDGALDDDTLHDCNNRASVWFTADRRYVVKAFLRINDSRNAGQRFGAERYHGEVRYTMSRVVGLLTPCLVARDDELGILVMEHVTGRSEQANLAHAITTLAADDGGRMLLALLRRWMAALVRLQTSAVEGPAWERRYALATDLHVLDTQVRMLEERGHELFAWRRALAAAPARLANTACDDVPFHGDWAPLNFLPTDTGDAIVDGEFCGRAPREKDLATGFVRMHQMNMRTAFIAPNVNLETRFAEAMGEMLAAYDVRAGRPADRAALFFFMGQDFLQRAHDQILFKDDDLSPSLYLELSRRYAVLMLASAGPETHEAFGRRLEGTFRASVAYAGILDGFRHGHVESALAAHRADVSEDTLQDVVRRMTLERDAVVRDRAFEALWSGGILGRAEATGANYGALARLADRAGHPDTAAALLARAARAPVAR